MKLHNQSLKYISVSVLVILSVWAVVFYFSMLDEIYDNIDDALEDQQELVLKKIEKDTYLLQQKEFAGGNFRIFPIGKSEAKRPDEKYTDTTVYLPLKKEHEPVRMYTSAFKQDGQYYEIQVISSVVEEDDLIETLFWSIVWLYLILIICIIVVNNVLLRKLWRPFYKLLQNLQSFRIEKQSRLTEIKTGTQEFIQLKRAADTLIQHASDAYNNQKQFTGNASHELQTPLAMLTGKLELLLENDSLNDEDAEKVAQALQITSRLTKLNKSLLLLSKIENGQFGDRQDVNLNHLISNVVEELEDFAQFKSVKIAIKEEQGRTIKADPMLARILVSNLIRNAIFHNLENGVVEIRIGDSMKVCNSSEEGQLDHNQIFNRFYKSSKSKESTGLGLSIVKAICKVYDFRINYSYVDKHCFEIHFS